MLNQLVVPSLLGVADGLATPMSIEALGFSPDGRQLLVKVSFLDDLHPDVLRSAVWTYDTATATYGAALNTTIKAADPLLGSPDIGSAVFSNWQGQSQILALMSDVADQGASSNHLVLIRDGVVIDTDVLQTIAGAQANQLISAIRVTENGRYAVIETAASNLLADMSDTNEVSDIYLLDLQGNTIQRISIANGAEIPDAAILGDVMIDQLGALNITFSSVGNFTTTTDTNAQPDIFLWKAAAAGTALSNPPTIEIVSQTGGISVSGDQSVLTQAGVLFQSASDALAPQLDSNGASDVFLSANNHTINVIPPSGNSLIGGASLGGASASGRYLAMLTASPEIAGATGVDQLVFVDRITGAQQIVSQINGGLADEAVLSPIISANGQKIAFSSQALNLQGGVPAPDMAMQLYLVDTIAAANSLPVGAVSINGSLAQNQIVTASNNLTDADGLGAISYQWQSNLININGATGSSYILQESEVGKFITVEARYIDAHGYVDIVTSAASIAVANVNDAPTGVVAISGNTSQNQTLTASNTLNDADGQGLISYQWQTNGADILGAMGSSYTLTAADVGKTVTLVARYTDGHGTAESVTSAATGVVTNNLPDLTVNSIDLGSIVNTITSSMNFMLNNSLSNLSIPLGLGSISGTGNALDNVLSGNESNNLLTGAGGNDEFAFAASGNGIDTITDFTQGDSITIAGANFSGAVTSGNGSTLLANQVQLSAAGGTTTFYIGTDSIVGADVKIYLTGLFLADLFSLNANRIFINIAPTGSVTITGIATQGQTLTAANTLADIDGLGAISYQWQANGANIAGATNSTYLLTQAEVGKAISVVASYTDGYGTAELVASRSTNVSAPPRTTSKYYITSSAGSNLLDFDLAYGALSLDGQEYGYSGTTGEDSVFVRPGIVFDFTGSSASADKLYLTGNYGDYMPSLAGTTMTLTRLGGMKTETVKVSKSPNVGNSDKLVFADGTVSTFDLSAHLNNPATVSAPVPVGETSLAPSLPTALNATVKAYALDSAGETFAPVSPGINLMVMGSAVEDIVYIKAGSNVDAASLGGGFDKIYFTGNWSEYTKTVVGTAIVFQRQVGADMEYVKVAAATGSNNDALIFADGNVRSNDAKAALQTDSNVTITALNGFGTTEVTPLGTGDIVTGTTAADTLNGTAAADVIYGSGGADTLNGAAGNDTIVISDTGTTASSSVTTVFTSTANGADTLIGFSAAPTANGGDVLDFTAIANLTDAVATGQTLITDFTANNVFIFDSTPITITEAANAIATDVSVLATVGYIVLADSANHNAVTVYHSTDLAANGTETALVILSGVAIANLTAGNFLV